MFLQNILNKNPILWGIVWIIQIFISLSYIFDNTLKLIIRANSPITQPGADGDLRL